MLNPISAYHEAGAKAGKARRQGDEATARFHSRWAHEAISLERPADKQAARDAFANGYKSAAMVRP